MTSAPLCLLALVVPACSISDELFEPPPPCEASPPILDDLRIAAGTTYVLEVPTADLELVSSDPTIIGVEPALADDAFALVSAQAGTVTLIARCAGSGRVVARAELVAAPVASIDLHFRAAPGANEPVGALAGLRGHSDAILVRYLGSDGEMLPGRGEFTVRGTGAVELVPPTPRLVSSVLFPKSTTVDLAFAAIGSAQLVAVAGGIERVLPIEVVTAPATLDLVAITHDNGLLVPATNPLPIGRYVEIDAIAKTADGRYVSGVPAVWTIPDRPQLEPMTAVLLELRDPGPIGITAAVGTLTATHELIAR